jgi:microcystin-dependent protein
MAEPFIGQIMLVGFNFAPTGWALCNGQLLPISQYTALFSLLGTTYGGNGTTNFALPNLQGRAAVGFGNGAGLSPYVLGQVTGSETVTLTVSQMPAHTHNINADSALAKVQSPSGAFLASADLPSAHSPVAVYTPTVTTPVTLNNGSVQATGGSQPHSNIQPVLALNYIIALQGIFPSRS